MNRDLKNIKNIIKIMRKTGVNHIKTGDIEINLAPHAFDKPEEKSNAEIKDKPILPDYSDEDLLFWSSPHAVGMSKDGQVN